MKGYDSLAGLKLVTATIIVAPKNVIQYKQKLVDLGANIVEEHNHSIYSVFIIEGIEHKSLEQFDKNDANDCFIHMAKFKNENHVVVLDCIQTERREKHIQVAYVSMFTEDKTRSIVTIYSNKSIDATHPNDYGLNWGGWGTMDIDTSEKFLGGIEIAVNLAKDLTAKFMK